MHRSRSAVAAGLGATALAGLVYLGIAIADDPPPAPAPVTPIAAAVAAGKHIRFDGPRGPIHVWVPQGYHADTGATVIYLHGYWDDADTAWTSQQLPEQFALSALNAVFVVPEAPVTVKVPVNYPDLGELLRLVEDRAGVVRGAALTVAVGHSGAFRTLEAWLDEPLLDQIVMIDAAYGDEPPLLAWFNGSPRRRLITVGADTILGTESLASKIPETVRIDRFPPSFDTMPAAAKTARHLYIRAQFDHFPLVRDGIAIPSLLRLMPIEQLASAPWQQPLGSIPALPDASTIPLTDGGVDLMLRYRLTLAIVVVALSALAWFLPQLRLDLRDDVLTWDAPKSEPAPFPAGNGPGLAPVARTRVILIDGLSEEVAKTLPAWTALCKRGVTLKVDVGFPTISLPVEVALWSGLTQQQSGVVFRDRRPLVPPLANSIPAQVPRSIAVAEYYGWIIRSLGFAQAEPAVDPNNVAKDANAEAWKTQWEARALAAVTSDAPLAFVHILRVDSAGHKHGVDADYRKAAAEADVVLGKLVAADPQARWFALSDHGHVAVGGHGGEERYVRQVQSCIAGPGITPGTTGALVHAVDVARALADSTGTKLDPQSRGRPYQAALAVPLERDQAVPPMALGTGAAAIFVLVAGMALVTWGVRKWWLAPWWFVIACASLFFIRGEPTLSMRMIYAPTGRDMWLTWLPALVIACAATVVGLRRTTIARVIIAQLALPIAGAAAVITACGAWPAVFGEHVAPVVPRYTAWLSPILLMVAHGSAAVALAGLATLVRPSSDRFAPPEPPRNEPADAS